MLYIYYKWYLFESVCYILQMAELGDPWYFYLGDDWNIWTHYISRTTSSSHHGNTIYAIT